MAKTYRTPSVVTLGNADVLTTGGVKPFDKPESSGSTSIALLDL
jgi:hypothetical protein